MRIKRWIVLSLAAALATLMLTGCPWDQDRPGGGASSQPGGDGVIVVPPGGDDDDDSDDPPVTYTITATAGTGGTAQPATQTVTAGQDASVAVAADGGYCIQQITVDGDVQFTAADASQTNYTVQFPAVDASHTVEASFAQVYTVTASIGAGGTVKLGGQPVADGDLAAFLAGDTLTFTVEPDSGYQIASVQADGEDLSGENGSYTYIVKGDCIIAVTFQKLTYTVTAKVSGTGGNVSVSPDEVEHGGSVTVTVTPEEGYTVGSVRTADGTSLTLNADGTYTLANVTEDQTITVTFVPTIDPDDPSTWRVENGTLIVPAAATELPEGIGEFVKLNHNITGIDLSQSGVTAIDSGAFYECDNLQSVTLGNVASIGNLAFAYSGLQSVTIGDGVSIGFDAFAFSGLQSVTMGDGVSIDSNAFAYTDLQSVTMGDRVSIGGWAFLNCGNLQMVVTGDVSSIDVCAFAGCERLARIRLGCMPESVGDYVFDNAGTNSIEIYIGGLTDAEKADVEGWFNPNITIAFLENDPYNNWVNGAGGGNALAQYLTRLF